jgi:CubicO group peptidase (beta-lactamase class C family)
MRTHTRRSLLRLAPLGLSHYASAQDVYYFPSRHEWKTQSASEAGFHPGRLQEAIAFAQSIESRTPRDLRRAHDLSFAREAYGEPLGPLPPRGDQTGVILRRGYLVAEWGQPHRADMTFSVTKSFVSTVTGLAVDRGLISSLDDRVFTYMPEPDALFAGDRNRRITWDHLLRQTSDWEGTLWGKPDWADRPPKDFQAYMDRKRAEPGTTWKYNDVRVNLLALCALHVWRRPLPEVLRELVMDPIGAGSTWRWTGYENAWVNVDGRMVQSVSGGGHWGGGMIISARDMARFGLLTMHRGQWAGRRILSDKWISMATTPTGPNPEYGFMNFYLNKDRKSMPSAPATAFRHVGNGSNIIYVDPEASIVAVVRWVDGAKFNTEFVQRLRDALV